MLKEYNLFNLVSKMLIDFLPIQAMALPDGSRAKLTCCG